jgi:hypothetical protein
MNSLINIIFLLLLTLGVGPAVKDFYLEIENTALKRIKKGLSRTEPFAQQLTGTKLTF